MGRLFEIVSSPGYNSNAADLNSAALGAAISAETLGDFAIHANQRRCAQRQSARFSAALETNRYTSTEAVIRDDLERGVVDPDRQFHRQFAADFSKGGDDPRSQEDRRDAGVLSGIALEAVEPFVFAGTNPLQAGDDTAVLSHPLRSGAAGHSWPKAEASAACGIASICGV